MKGPGSLREA